MAAAAGGEATEGEEHRIATKYFATLQFEANGPTVEGEWTDGTTAWRTYRDWVGLYGSNPSVVIRLIEETDGRRQVLKTWTEQGEAG